MIYDWRVPIFIDFRMSQNFVKKMAAINQAWQTLLETGKLDLYLGKYF